MIDAVVTFIFWGLMVLAFGLGAGAAIVTVDQKDKDGILAVAALSGFVFVGIDIWYCTNGVLLWVGADAAVASVVSKIVGLVFGTIAAVGFEAIASWAIGKSPVAETMPPLRDSGGDTGSSDNAHVARMLTTALENSGQVRTAWQAAANKRATDAQVAALADAERLALAATRAAEAEAKGIEAMLHRADRMTELTMRQAVEDALRKEQLAAAGHKLALAEKGRAREQLLADRETLIARYGLQSERIFKRDRFALGRKRIEARITEAHVGVVVARDAAGESPNDSGQPKLVEADLLAQLIARKQKEIAEREADGTDTSLQRAQLENLKSLAKQFEQAAAKHAQAN